jgi:hypothetical protein
MPRSNDSPATIAVVHTKMVMVMTPLSLTVTGLAPGDHSQHYPPNFRKPVRANHFGVTWDQGEKRHGDE